MKEFVVTTPERKTKYHGFTNLRHPEKCKCVAVVLFDGEWDLYDVGNDIELAEKEIKRMYRDDYDREPESITFFNR